MSTIVVVGFGGIGEVVEVWSRRGRVRAHRVVVELTGRPKSGSCRCQVSPGVYCGPCRGVSATKGEKRRLWIEECYTGALFTMLSDRLAVASTRDVTAAVLRERK